MANVSGLLDRDRDEDRRRIVQDLKLLFGGEDGVMLFVTIAIASWVVERGYLSPDIVRSLKRWTQGRLRRIRGLKFAAGTVDLSFNVIDNDGAFWCPHVHIVVQMRGAPQRATKRLMHALKCKPNVDLGFYRPLHIKPVRDLDKALRYLTKIADPQSVYVRSSYLDEHGKRRSRKQSLKGPERIEAIALMSSTPVDDFLILVGLARRGETFVRLRKRLTKSVLSNEEDCPNDAVDRPDSP